MISGPVSPSSHARATAIPAPACLLVACLVAGCTLPVEEGPPARTPIAPPSVTGTPDCFYPGEVQDFQVLDPSNLIVKAPNDRHAYHIRISPPAPELRFAEGIAFLPAQGRLCGYAGERLIAGQPRSRRRFAIIGVSRLSPDTLATLSGAREAGPAPEVPRPQPGPGAEIEGGAGAAGPAGAGGGGGG